MNDYLVVMIFAAIFGGLSVITVLDGSAGVWTVLSGGSSVVMLVLAFAGWRRGRR